MTLGIFDSGLGGLYIARAIRRKMPDIDMLYYGDTLHLPYGNRSDEAIYTYTKNAMELMFEQGCKLIVIACNTASAAALRRLQQQWLPRHYPDRNIIGVVVPTLETALDLRLSSLGLIGTNYIVSSGIYEEELSKLQQGITFQQCATPLLVPLIENDGMEWIDSVLERYLSRFDNINGLLLGCTHYCMLKERIRAIVGQGVTILSQDEIIPDKLNDYLDRHPEYSGSIGRNGLNRFLVSDLTDNYLTSARQIYGQDIKIERIEDLAHAA